MKEAICVFEGHPAHSINQPGRFLSAPWPGLWALGLVLFCETWLVGAPSGGGSWPTWRGPGGLGVAPDAQPLIEWSETKNVKWKVKIPGSGYAMHSRLLVDGVPYTYRWHYWTPAALSAIRHEGWWTVTNPDTGKARRL